MQGEPISSGISQGTAYLIRQEVVTYACPIQPEEIPGEYERLEAGVIRAARNLELLIEKVRREMGDDKAEIFEGHLEIVTSEDVDEEVKAIILEKRVCAEEAVRLFSEANALEMEELDDPYFKERGQDFRDIGTQLIRSIGGDDAVQQELPAQAIIVSEELTPSQTAALDLAKIQGMIISKGGVNSHAAIIARSQEIPAIILRDPSPLSIIRDGDLLVIDGFSGEIWINPEEAVITRLEKKKRKVRREREELLKILEEESVTTDGKHVGLYSNVGGLHDIEAALRYKSDGIGLFRTEFLFMETMSTPSLARQVEAYTQAITAMDGKQVIIRLLDTGADKPLPYWTLAQEDNPFLGVRGIRLLFEKESVLRTQIQALLLASRSGPVGLMIPMVASLLPITRVRALIEEEKTALDWDGPDQLTLGVMIETPAAVQLIEEILAIVDFVSIGTNDLTQYTLAADRGNPSVHAYYDEFHPAVLRSIAHVIRKACKMGKMNGICGELAGNPLALPYFVGLGVQELSATPVRLPDLKYLVRNIDSREAAVLVEEILRLPTSEGIRSRLGAFLTERNLMK